MSAPTVSREILRATFDVLDELHLDWIDVGDIVHQVVGDCAQINTACVDDQLSYLITLWGVDNVKTALREIADARDFNFRTACFNPRAYAERQASAR
jgi:hypothetical protein